MPLFRRVPPLHKLAFRTLNAADLPAIQELISQTEWTALAIPQDEFLAVLSEGLSMAAEYEGKLWMVALIAWSQPPIAWVRTLAVRSPLRPTEGLPLFFSAMRRSLVAIHAASELYVMSDQFDVVWLRPALLAFGFEAVVEVIGYEKHSLFIPDWGDTRLQVRRATSADIAAIAQVDATAFATEWVKSPLLLSQALAFATCYLVALHEERIMGYAFATIHHGGTVAHLVRIAVDPTYQGTRAGVRLLAEVTHWCQQHAVQTLSLNTQASNAHAQRLYTWFGFHRTSERQLVLALRLPPPAAEPQALAEGVSL